MTMKDQMNEARSNAMGTVAGSVAREIRNRLEDYRKALEWLTRDCQEALGRLDAIDLGAATDAETYGIRLDDERLLSTILGAIVAGRQAVRSSLVNDVVDRAQNIEDHVRIAQLIQSAFNAKAK